MLFTLSLVSFAGFLPQSLMLLEVIVAGGQLKQIANFGKKILIPRSLNTVGNTKDIISTQLNNIHGNGPVIFSHVNAIMLPIMPFDVNYILCHPQR